jgi:hypothetical protein
MADLPKMACSLSLPLIEQGPGVQAGQVTKLVGGVGEDPVAVDHRPMATTLSRSA